MSRNVLGDAQTAKQSNLELEMIERQVYARQHEAASQSLLKLLHYINLNQVGLGDTASSSEAAREHKYQNLQLLSRLAGCISTLLADPDFKLSQQGFELFMAYKRFMTAVFMASGFRNTNHLVGLAGQRGDDGQVRIANHDQLRKFLLVTTPCTPIEKFNIPELLPKLPPEIAIPFWISFVDPELLAGRQEAKRRHQVVMLFNRLSDDFVLPDQMLARVINAWMYLSYMDFREKHQPKKYINRLLRRWAESKGVKAPAAVRREVPPGEKPRLLVATEHFRTEHAMHRCYRKAIDSLREHFHTIGLCIDTTIDDEAAQAFDEVHTFPAEEDIRKIAGRIVKLAPDIIYYPSLGMQNWTTVLAQFRFAAMQCMSLGHPATSMSECIDYAFAGDVDPDLFSERIVYGYARGFRHLPYPGDVDFTRKRQDTELVGHAES